MENKRVTKAEIFLSQHVSPAAVVSGVCLYYIIYIINNIYRKNIMFAK